MALEQPLSGNRRRRPASSDMNIVVLTHPPTLGSASMPRLARWLGEGMKSRGHEVTYWTSSTWLGRLPIGNAFVQKWLSYFDQFLIYPILLAKQVRKQSGDTLFVVTDQALGMWVPRIAHRPHVVHCNDFLAIRSALGEFTENPTSWTGKRYQALICKGLSRGKNFVCISNATEADLKRLVDTQDIGSQTVHLDLNGNFRVIDKGYARTLLGDQITSDELNGFLLHVGGNPWYKNRLGVIELYRAWCTTTSNPIPLWMIGEPPTDQLTKLAANIPNDGKVRFLTNVSDEQLVAAYNLALLLIFTSLEEGFGWPIAEAMACGCPVLTTDRVPMTEVGEYAVSYLRRQQIDDDHWAADGARQIASILAMTSEERKDVVERGFQQAVKFSTNKAIEAYEKIYQAVLDQRHLSSGASK